MAFLDLRYFLVYNRLILLSISTLLEISRSLQESFSKENIMSRIFFTAIIFLSATLSAATIGTFNNRSGILSQFSLISAQNMETARNLLVTDGHNFQNLDSGINSTSLASVDAVYLTIASSASVINGSEVSSLNSFVNTGGLLVVQGDLDNAYDNLYSSLGVTHNFFPGVNSPVSVTTSFAPITNGPFGTVSSFFVSVPSTFDLPTGGIQLDTNGVIGVIQVGQGNVVLLGDVNSFDGPTNANGIVKEDNTALWRNIFALTNSGNAVPEPSSVLLLSLAFISLAWQSTKK